METGTLSYELLLRYLTLCVSGGHNAEVFDVYDIMRGNFPSLETGASSLFIKSFCRTEKWQEALVILGELKKVNSCLIFYRKHLKPQLEDMASLLHRHPVLHSRSLPRHRATMGISSRRRC